MLWASARPPLPADCPRSPALRDRPKLQACQLSSGHPGRLQDKGVSYFFMAAVHGWGCCHPGRGARALGCQLAGGAAEAPGGRWCCGPGSLCRLGGCSPLCWPHAAEAPGWTDSTQHVWAQGSELVTGAVPRTPVSVHPVSTLLSSSPHPEFLAPSETSFPSVLTPHLAATVTGTESRLCPFMVTVAQHTGTDPAVGSWG